MTYVGRFAPTPSGPLHFGSLLTALGSFLDARTGGGRWLLRIDDLDVPRIVPGAEALICDQLRAYGLDWDGAIARQSAHVAAYQRMLDALRGSGRIYACRCTRARLRSLAREGEELVYDGHCRNAGHADEGASLRLRLDDPALGDPVIRRSDKQFAYALACAVDETLMGITDVVRGADLIPSTARQQQILVTLGLPLPRYRHLPLIVGMDGRKLSKQNHAAPLDGRNASVDLRRALHLLGQEPPPDSAATTHAILGWAGAAWDPHRVPAGPIKLAQDLA